MATATLSRLVNLVRAEAGHALSASQGLNALDTIKHLIRRTEEELWTAFYWPTLTVRWDVSVQVDQFEYLYPAELQFDQIRQIFWAPVGGKYWTPLEFGIKEEMISPYGGSIEKGPTLLHWDVGTSEDRIRVWPTPAQTGFIRIKGMKPLNPMCEDDDCCTLDPTLISLFVSAELLSRAKAADAGDKMQKAQRHLQKLLGNKVGAKVKVSTFGVDRMPGVRTLRPGIDYIP